MVIKIEILNPLRVDGIFNREIALLLWSNNVPSVSMNSEQKT